MRPKLVVSLVAAMMVVGCADQGEPGSASVEEGYVTDVRTDPDLMQAVPNVVRAGAAFEVVFPGGSTRGSGFVLENGRPVRTGSGGTPSAGTPTRRTW